MTNSTEVQPFYRRLWFIMLTSGLLGGAIFLAIYGVRILDPTYDDWLLQGGDMTQHYIGWMYFRRSDWHFPIGMIDGLLGKINISVMYTDSVPLLAIFFKLLSPILPETFQYFGIMGLCAFILDGACASLLIHRFNKNPLFCTLGSTIYVMCPAIFHRLYGHEALAFHYIILLGLSLWLYQDKRYKKRWQRELIPPVLWGLLGMLAVGTHSYLLVIVCFFLLGSFVTDIVKHKNPSRPLFCLSSTILMSMLMMWLLGGFATTAPSAAEGLGVCSANLNTFFNPFIEEGSGMVGYPAGGSILLPSLPCNEGQVEGYAYLGLGVMLGIVLCIVTLIVSAIRCKGGFFSNIRRAFTTRKVWTAAVVFVFAAAFFFALSPKCVLGHTTIYDIHYPEKIMNMMSTFRATGRFAWICDYLIFTAVLYGLSRIKGKKLMIAALALCVAVQTADLSVTFRSRRWYHEKHEYVSPLGDPRWELLSEGCDKFIALEYMQSPEQTFAFAMFALKHDMKLYHFYVARPPMNDIIYQCADSLDAIQEDRADPTALYVFIEEKYIPARAKNLKIYEVDGLYVAKCPGQYDALAESEKAG